jgi:hypothetical protein
VKSNPNRGSKPGERRGGRKKGTPNKVSGDLRAMVLGALDRVGGQTYLEQQARENPQAFMTMVGRCLPKQVNLGGDLSLTLELVSPKNREARDPV